MELSTILEDNNNIMECVGCGFKIKKRIFKENQTFYRVCLDFDGVLNNYQGYDGDNLYAPKDGVELFLKALKQVCYKVVILTARNTHTVMKWLKSYNLDGYIDEVTRVKPPAEVYIDDRGLKFNGNYMELLNELSVFKPYWEA